MPSRVLETNRLHNPLLNRNPTWNDFSDLTIPQFLSVCRQVTSGLSPPFNEGDILTLRKADKAIGTELVYITYLRGEVHVLCMRWRFEREQEEHVEGGQGREKCKYIIITINKYNFLSVSFQVLTRVT